MCLATPIKIISKIKSQNSKVLVEGNKEVDISLVPDANIGDWLLCHAELAVQKITSEQAEEILSLQKECHHHH